MTVAPAQTPIADFALKVSQDIKGSFEKARDTRTKEFKNQGLMGKVAYYAAKVFEVIGKIMSGAGFIPALAVLPIVVVNPAFALISLGCAAVGALGLVTILVSQYVQKKFAKVTPYETAMINALTTNALITDKNKNELPGVNTLWINRHYLNGFLVPLKEGELASSPTREKLRTALGLVDGKKPLEEAMKDQKKLTPGQVKLVKDLGTMTAVCYLLESIQYVAANRLEDARKTMKTYKDIQVTAFPKEIADKIQPLVAKLQAPDADFQKKVYNALTKKDMPNGLEAQIFQGIAEAKDAKKFTFKLSDLDTLAAIK